MIVCAHCGRDRAAAHGPSITTLPDPSLAEADELALCCSAGQPARLREAVFGAEIRPRPAGREVELPDARREVAAAARQVDAALAGLAALARERARQGEDRDPGILLTAVAAEDAGAHLARAVWGIDPRDVGRVTWLHPRRAAR